ncbi:MAG: hypothetical protein KAX11_07835 [Candidatus Aminicenantes bacterium]|nr:hypothetical protein [Candidatus Aminicenantes bacterium]
MKRKILSGFLLLFLIYCGWFIYQSLAFHTFTQENIQTYPDEIKGVYHLHSTLSDGHKPPEKIVRIASDNDLDFIILTDHGNPNFESMATRGWRHGVLMLAGSELSVNRGHLVGIGFDTPEHRFSQNAEESASQIARLNGISIIAHPYSRVSWTWGDLFIYSGIEIMNASSSVRRDFASLIPYLPAYIIRPDLFLIRMLDSPSKNLKKWDKLNRKHTVYAYFSADSHFYYGPMFRLFRIHILIKAPLPKEFDAARNIVYEALKKGNFYNAIDSAAEAEGFRFFGISGENKIDMGQSSRFDPSITLHVQAPFPFKKVIHLIQNGETVSESEQDYLFFRVKSPGVYRIEVFLKGRTPLKKEIPWIVSNPIFLR